MTTARTRLTALAAAALVMVTTAGCVQPSPTDLPSLPSSTAPTGPVSPGTSTVPSSSPLPATTTLTAEAAAYANAEVVYRRFMTSFASAKTNFDPSKLDSGTATPAVLADVKSELARLRGEFAGYHVTARWTQKIQSVVGTKYEAGRLAQLQVCAITNSRYIRDGKDVTTDKEGTPVGINTTPRANQIEMRSIDGGKTWKVNSFVYADDRGAQC